MIKQNQLLKEQDKRQIVLTQQQTHELFEGPDYRIADKYSTIYKSILMSMFYICIFPYGMMMQVLSLFLGMQIIKKMFLSSNYKQKFKRFYSQIIRDFSNIDISWISMLLVCSNQYKQQYDSAYNQYDIILLLCWSIFLLKFQSKITQTDAAICLIYYELEKQIFNRL
ncbi:unnamed protein product [Paramecium sonneborni]|uniref:Transmembrane protein n=1 Tax=Paramecium sonneborni TaxID=65129 RepID=A0A8S1MZJ9_9CILI|nr:unnamed protein product [Paramecium sonneborni]